jgi:hypothetical protein
MQLPFSPEQFLGVFAAYNNAVWPMQIVLMIAALGTIVLALYPCAHSDRMISTILALLWIWTGIAYHLAHFSSINKAAYAFAAACIVQGGLFLWMTFRGTMMYQPESGWRKNSGVLFLLYALAIYPLLGLLFGHTYPNAPTFGAPCPTTIFTLGMLAWTRKAPRILLIVPIVWSVVGFSAAVTMGIYEDIGLLLAGLGSGAMRFFPSKTEAHARL